MPSIKDPEEQTIKFYNRESEKFVEDTQNIDMNTLYKPFLALLKPGARILDAGCGSGRDSKYFLMHGYKVTAFDASSEMVKRASEFIGQPVLQLKFNQVDFYQEFDSVWACASLLHVPKKSMKEVIDRLGRSLLIGGIFYLSYKYGEAEHIRNFRYFSDYTENSFTELIRYHSTLSVIKIWKTSDLRPMREGNFWLNVIMKKEKE